MITGPPLLPTAAVPSMFVQHPDVSTAATVHVAPIISIPTHVQNIIVRRYTSVCDGAGRPIQDECAEDNTGRAVSKDGRQDKGKGKGKGKDQTRQSDDEGKEVTSAAGRFMVPTALGIALITALHNVDRGLVVSHRCK